jgi:TatD DNase family protein
VTWDLIDSHAHLDGPEFDADRAECLTRARAAGVGTIVLIGASGDIASARRAVALAATDAGLWATVGIHPHEAGRADDSWWSVLDELGPHPRVVAIGETGLDYHYDHSTPEQQRAAFARQLELAAALGKPVVCHIRDAHADARAMVAERGTAARGCLIHCFTGTAEEAEAWVALGCHVSFSGIVTFRGAKNEPLREAARRVPLERLLVETDCPYLAPEPMRGKRNEPAYVRHTVELLARVRGLDPAELAARTALNARTFFALTR